MLDFPVSRNHRDFVDFLAIYDLELNLSVTSKKPAMSLVSFFSQYNGQFCPAELNFFCAKKFKQNCGKKKNSDKKGIPPQMVV